MAKSTPDKAITIISDEQLTNTKTELIKPIEVREKEKGFKKGLAITAIQRKSNYKNKALISPFFYALYLVDFFAPSKMLFQTRLKNDLVLMRVKSMLPVLVLPL